MKKLLHFQVFLLFLYIIVEQWRSSEGEVGDYIKRELTGGRFPKHLNTFSN